MRSLRSLGGKYFNKLDTRDWILLGAAGVLAVASIAAAKAPGLDGLGQIYSGGTIITVRKNPLWVERLQTLLRPGRRLI